jgi:hypothetical protein
VPWDWGEAWGAPSRAAEEAPAPAAVDDTRTGDPAVDDIAVDEDIPTRPMVSPFYLQAAKAGGVEPSPEAGGEAPFDGGARAGGLAAVPPPPSVTPWAEVPTAVYPVPDLDGPQGEGAPVLMVQVQGLLMQLGEAHALAADRERDVLVLREENARLRRELAQRDELVRALEASVRNRSGTGG